MLLEHGDVRLAELAGNVLDIVVFTELISNEPRHHHEVIMVQIIPQQLGLSVCLFDLKLLWLEY